MHTDVMPPPRDPGDEWGMPVALALLVHVLVALVFIVAWLWSPSRSTEAAAGDPAVEASLQLSAAEAAAARSALRASEKLPVLPEPVQDVQPEPVVEDTIPPPQPLPEPRPQDAPTPQQYNAQERIAQPDNVDQERVSALAIAEEKAKQEQEAKRRQEQIDLTERKRVEEAEQKLRLARQQEEADRQKKLAEEQRQANEAKAEQERQQKIAEIRRKREQAEREAKLAEQRLNQVKDAQSRAQAASSNAAASSGTPQPSPGQGGTSDDLLAKYQAAIKQAVQSQWVRPDSVPLGQKCTITIRQLPGGEVPPNGAVQFAANCPYDAAGRRSVEAAVLRAQPLPYRGFESVFQRAITFHFEAKDR
ncbi:membrane protein TolA [Stenotrophomonas daejeonensis]|uniref:Membrane protein TolA n=1 Tax=Stenotrophomonas daejeonensis TaxID=659018 RepID=A0A0R0DZK1_9GAMM|nr:cell envelope integrity protein TolA [Stenotrophomonas daejeonensis]KRG83134.1 membrane protein TolA [Stenotrophomonas daejeonensis]